jgi:hypothetical protein
MKLKTLMRWVGPAAIGAGVFSGLSGLPFHVPYLSQNDPTGYQVVGSGLILLALTLLLVGMLGLYASQAGSTGARVIESGAGYPRHERSKLVEEDPGWLGRLHSPSDSGVAHARHRGPESQGSATSQAETPRFACRPVGVGKKGAPSWLAGARCSRTP